MAKKRFVLEGEWSGYHSGQQRVVHREVTTSEARLKITGIRYTDGTCLYLTARPCKPRERVKPMLSYKSLLDDCVFHKLEGFVSVDQVRAAEKAWKESRAPNCR
jgi:hypothetical protein